MKIKGGKMLAIAERRLKLTDEKVNLTRDLI